MIKRRVNTTRSEIISIATRLFLEKGYSATSPKAINSILAIYNVPENVRQEKVKKVLAQDPAIVITAVGVTMESLHRKLAFAIWLIYN